MASSIIPVNGTLQNTSEGFLSGSNLLEAQMRFWGNENTVEGIQAAARKKREDEEDLELAQWEEYCEEQDLFLTAKFEAAANDYDYELKNDKDLSHDLDYVN